MAIDWQAMEAEYVTTDISLRDLAEKHGAIAKTVMRHCKKGEWTRKRDGYVRKVSAKCTQKSETVRVTEILDDMDSIKRISGNLVKAMIRMSVTLAICDDLKPKDLVDAEKALTARLDNYGRIYGEAEGPPTIEVVMTGKAKEWGE